MMVFFISCSNNDEPDYKNYSEIWQLAKMTVINIDNEFVTTGGDMEWQENLSLNNDGTFIKERWREDEIIQASGVFEHIILGNENYIELTYSVDSELIANCTSDLKEILFFEEEEHVLRGIWQNCDGPELEYYRQFICGTGL